MNPFLWLLWGLGLLVLLFIAAAVVVVVVEKVREIPPRKADPKLYDKGGWLN